MAPLLSFPGLEMQSRLSFNNLNRRTKTDDSDTPNKRWYHYLPLCGTVLLILAPHPSWLYVLVDFYLLTRQQNKIFVVHLLATYALTFMALSSLMICVIRDPGPVTDKAQKVRLEESNNSAEEEVGLTDALAFDEEEDLSQGRWCRKCWEPKPERAHHCSICNRCVLKMDHHCPWLGATCIGHRTYPAFVHFLCCVTFLALYIAVVSIFALVFAFNNPFEVHEFTPVHEIGLAFAGVVFTLVIGSFWCYHLYLITTNQTTLENINPFMILRHLPPLPRAGHSLSDPPLEPELSYAQRMLVKDAQNYIRIYDIGWRENWSQVFGCAHGRGWVYRLWYGGASPGDGRHFVRNPRSKELLARLATELVEADRNNT